MIATSQASQPFLVKYGGVNFMEKRLGTYMLFCVLDLILGRA